MTDQRSLVGERCSSCGKISQVLLALLHEGHEWQVCSQCWRDSVKPKPGITTKKR